MNASIRAVLGLIPAFLLAALHGAAAQGYASMEMRRADLDLGLRLALPSLYRLGLDMMAEAEGGRLRAFLELGLEDGGQAALSIGPADPEGCLRFILSPLSATRVEPSPPVKIDRSMQAARSAISLGRNGIYAFSIARGSGGPLSLDIEGPALSAGEEAAKSRVEAAAAGIAFAGESAGASWAALVDLSSRPPDQGGDGWMPSRPSDAGGTIAHASFLARREAGASSACAALAVSAGSLEGRSLAAKLQAEGKLGPISLNASIGAADAGYRGLFGEAQDELLLLKLGASIALRRAVSLSAARELAAERSGALLAPAWTAKGEAALSAALGEGRSLRLSGEFGAGVKGKAALDLRRSAALGSASGAARGNARSALGLCYRWDRTEARRVGDSLELGVEIARDFGGPMPDIDLRSAIRVPIAGEGGYPAARGRLAVAVPIGAGREISASLSLPEKGIALGPVKGTEDESGVELSIGYRASIETR